ncbi:hypothetical protein GCM10020358_75610 [Amorphoplanes nipponensis]|uniref:Uncharacterized protein n=1 Tax=Actinoplanes nipponensis TaxID=135950 RepID=A0A919MM09_9ACTN|nr:hypothetical protein [Actinoplanes nipponensis]GIE50076.1 hypothetical protein Ani05nite_36100 [Actinoplanes nipponensis]
MTGAVLRRQRELNLGSAGLWDGFAEHRRRVTGLILAHRTGRPASRLVVLGAGNGNDLELGRLLTAFAAVDLVDIDADALAGAVARQRITPGARLRLHGGVDLTEATPEQLRRLSQADVVVSTTLLTQLIDFAAADGATGPELLAVRDRHLRLISDLVMPRGTGVLVTDVVSSDTCPPLRGTGIDGLGPLLAECVNAGNFFTGANPFAIERRLRADPELPLDRIGMAPPWRWDLGERSYLVSALAFRKQAEWRRIDIAG